MRFHSRYLLFLVIIAVTLSGCGEENTIVPVSSTGAISTQSKNISQLLQPGREDIQLPGSTSRFDYQSLDSKSGLLFIAHLGDSSLVVFNIKTGSVITELKGLGGIHGVLVVPELRKVFATATSDHQVVVIDEDSLKILDRVPAGTYPDGMAYAPNEHKLFISDEGGKAEPVIDTQTYKALSSIELGGEAGNTQYDSNSRHVFVNVQSLTELVELDPTTNQIIARYPLPDCQNNHGLQIDPVQRLAFMACDENARLLVLDMQANLKVISTQTVGSDPDVLALDSEKHWLYVAAESGTISIFDIKRPTVQKLAEGFLANGAHTISVDNTSHYVFLPLAEVKGKPVLRVMRPV